MIRILEVVGRMDRAGQETFLMNVLRSCDKEKFDIEFSVNTEYIGDYEKEINTLGSKVYHNPYSVNLRNSYNYLKYFRKLLRDNGPYDVVHCHTWLFGGFIMWAAKKEGVPCRIMHSHSTSGGVRKSWHRKFYEFIAQKLILKEATYKVACGEEAYLALFGEECSNKNKILNNAIDVNKFDERNFDIKSYRNGLSLDENCEVVISVARFCDVKNHKKIISVFARYLIKHPNAVLFLVGDGELKDEILSQVLQLGITENVKFMGVRDDVNNLLMCSDAFIMPSKFEGLPVSLVEAQAAGVACVISDSITDEVDMKLGLISNLDINASDEEWAHKLEIAVNTKKPEYLIRKSQITKNGYSLESVWKKLEKIYEKKS